MDAWSRLRRALAMVVVLAAAAGCTPVGATTPTASPTPPTSPPRATSTPSVVPTQTPSVTPSATWSVEQAAAVDAVTKFSAADDEIGANPSSFTKKEMTALMEQYSGGGALDSTERWHLRLREKGYRMVGSMRILSTVATEPVDEDRGVAVKVIRCQDQRDGQVVDKQGVPVSDEEYQIPEYNLRQYAVRKPPGEDAFRVFGFETIDGKCP